VKLQQGKTSTRQNFNKAKNFNRAKLQQSKTSTEQNFNKEKLQTKKKFNSKGKYIHNFKN
jgi:hypothetical protein